MKRGQVTGGDYIMRHDREHRHVYANPSAHRGVLEEGVRFIAKPFSLTTLAEKVREVLDG